MFLIEMCEKKESLAWKRIWDRHRRAVYICGVEILAIYAYSRSTENILIGLYTRKEVVGMKRFDEFFLECFCPILWLETGTDPQDIVSTIEKFLIFGHDRKSRLTQCTTFCCLWSDSHSHHRS